MRRLISIRMFILCMTLSLLFGALSVYVTAAQDAAPYLYYFHPDLNAWVIERADGTDGRLLGQGMTTDSNSATGYWSHTGKWFAWRSNYYTGDGGVGNFKWHAIRSDGTHPVDIADQFNNVDYIQWATHSDYLFVRSNLDSHSYSLIDIPNEKIIWSQVVEVTPVHIEGKLVGDYFVYWEYGGQNRTQLRESVKILALSSGEVLNIPENDSDREIYQQVVDPSRVSQPYLKIDVGLQGGLLILDVVKGELFEIDPKAMQVPSYSGEYLQWSSDGQYALLAISGICQSIRSVECVDLWLISPEQRLVQHIADNVVWNVGISNRAIILWIDKKPIAIFANQDGTVFALDARSGVVKPILHSKASLPLQWVAVGDTIYFATQANMRAFGTASVAQAQLLAPIYLTFGNTNFLPADYGNLQLSPDGRYLGLADFEAIYDIESNSVLEFPPHSGATFGSRFGAYYKWDTSSKWLITGQITYYAGGRGGPHRNMVFRSDGSDRRELNTFWGKPEWLPTNVISHLPPAQPNSILPQPYLTLEYSENITGTAWNATGSRLAVADEKSRLYIWSFKNAKPQVEQVIQLDSRCGYFVSACRINWSLDGRFISLGAFSKTESTVYFGLIDLQTGKMIGTSRDPFEWNEKGFSISNLKPTFPYAENATLTAQYTAQNAQNDTNGLVEIYQKEPWQYVVQFRMQEKVETLRWAADSEHFFAQTHCSLQKWGIKEGLIDTFKPYSYCSSSVYVTSPHGEWSATETIYQPSQVFHFGSNTSPRSLNWYAKSVSFSPDDCWLTASNSWLVTIWKLSDLISDAPTNTDTCISLVKGTYKVKPS